MVDNAAGSTALNTTATAFDTFNRLPPQSSVLEDIWRKAYTSSYPSEAQPNAFYPQSVLDDIITTTTSTIGKTSDTDDPRTLVDIGCGHGLTGLYLAKHLDMTLVGYVSPASIALAKVK